MLIIMTNPEVNGIGYAYLGKQALLSIFLSFLLISGAHSYTTPITVTVSNNKLLIIMKLIISRDMKYGQCR